MSKDEALHQATLSWLQQATREPALPYYWANLTLMCNADKIELKQKTNTGWYATGGLLLMVIAGNWFWYKRKRKKALLQ